MNTGELFAFSAEGVEVIVLGQRNDFAEIWRKNCLDLTICLSLSETGRLRQKANELKLVPKWIWRGESNKKAILSAFELCLTRCGL